MGVGALCTGSPVGRTWPLLFLCIAAPPAILPTLKRPQIEIAVYFFQIIKEMPAYVIKLKFKNAIPQKKNSSKATITYHIKQ